MSAFKRLMVGLDFSDTDHKVLAYTKMLKDYLKPEVIYFFHAEKSFDLPEELLEEIDHKMPLDESIRQEMESVVGEYFQEDPVTKIDFAIIEGDAFKQILHWSHVKKIDLFVAGKKKQQNGRGVLPQNLARKIDASVLFVPEDLEHSKVEDILIPVDFSEHSRQAIKLIHQVFGNGAKYSALNCYHVPSGWHYTGKSKEEVAAIMKKHAVAKFNSLNDELSEVELKAVYAYDENNDPSDEIYEVAEKSNTDLVVIGARGKSDAATFVLGSTTEKILSHERLFPLLVIKKKGENIGFLEAIFKLK